MTGNQSMDLELVDKLAELKEKDPMAYEKKLQNMKTVMVDWMRCMLQVAKEIEKGDH